MKPRAIASNPRDCGVASASSETSAPWTTLATSASAASPPSLYSSTSTSKEHRPSRCVYLAPGASKLIATSRVAVSSTWSRGTYRISASLIDELHDQPRTRNAVGVRMLARYPLHSETSLPVNAPHGHRRRRQSLLYGLQRFAARRTARASTVTHGLKWRDEVPPQSTSSLPSLSSVECR